MKSLKRVLPVFSKTLDRRAALLTGAVAVLGAACGPMVATRDGEGPDGSDDRATPPEDTGAAPDAMTSAPDAGIDATSAHDAAPDAMMSGPDAAPDARPDASIDAAREASVDASREAAVDAAAGCPAGSFVAGPASMFAMGSRTFFEAQRLFVIRDSGGFYAMTSSCTHRGTNIEPNTGPGFTCPDHGSQFNNNGAVTGGPATAPLAHYAMCRRGDGRLTVDTSMTVPAARRLAP